LEVRAKLDELVRRANILARTYAGAVDSVQVHTDRLGRTPSISPIAPNAGWFTSAFSQARIHPIFHEARPHSGIDFSAPTGTAILASANGRVIDVGVRAGYGKVVRIDHGNGIHTMYAHCSSIDVEVGEWVQRGVRIAQVGSTGISTGPHLHYEVIVNGWRVDPNDFILENRSIPD
jgi:murein DD-endopeptidase MepM/ murein hydrolase activator NlpD